MTWFVTRQPNGALASLHRDHMPGDNDEALDDSSPEIVAFLAVAQKVSPAPLDARLWVERLSAGTRQVLWAAALANPSILGWPFLASGAQAGITVTDPDTIAGVGALVTAGVLTPTDQATLLTP